MYNVKIMCILKPAVYSVQMFDELDTLMYSHYIAKRSNVNNKYYRFMVLKQ